MFKQAYKLCLWQNGKKGEKTKDKNTDKKVNKSNKHKIII